MDKKIAAYRLDLKSKYRFYLSMFFLSHGCHTFKQSYCLHETWWWHIVTNFKIDVAKALIGRWSNRNKLFSTTRLSKQKFHEPSMTKEVPIRTPEFQQKWMRCHYCKDESSDLKCQTCGLHLCLTKEINCFLRYHL